MRLALVVVLVEVPVIVAVDVTYCRAVLGWTDVVVLISFGQKRFVECCQSWSIQRGSDCERGWNGCRAVTGEGDAVQGQKRDRQSATERDSGTLRLS